MNKFKVLSHVALWAIAMAIFSQQGSAAIIVYDAFDDAPSGAFNSVGLNGTTPNTNLPGSSWVVRGTSVASERPANFFLAGPAPYGSAGLTPYLFMDFERATISLSGYNSGLLSISAYMAPTSSSGPLSLGFASDVANGGGYQFYGLNLYNNGGVQTTLNGATSSTVAYSGGSFTPATVAYLLNFTVDTSTGALSSISLSGSTADYSSLLGGSSFNLTNTAYASLNTGYNGNYIGLTVETIPEPSTWVMLSGGMVFLLVARRRRLRQA